MNAQAQRVQLSLFAVDDVDNVFGITSRDHTCVKCGHAMMHVEDSDGAYYGFPPQVIEEVCSNEECEAYHGDEEI
jgi:hypothetical protein